MRRFDRAAPFYDRTPFGEDSEIIKPRLNILAVEQLELFGESLFDFNTFEDARA